MDPHTNAWKRADPEGHRFDADDEAHLIVEVLSFSSEDPIAFVEWQEKLAALGRRDSVAAVEAAQQMVRYPANEEQSYTGIRLLQALVPKGRVSKDAAWRFFTDWLESEPDAKDGHLPLIMSSIGLELEAGWFRERLDSPAPMLRLTALQAAWEEMRVCAARGTFTLDGAYPFESVRALDTLLRCAQDEDVRVRQAAARMLGNCGSWRRSTPRGRGALLTLLRDAEDDIRAIALSGLCLMNEPGVAEPLRRELEAVLAGPDRIVNGRRLGPGHLMYLCEAVDSLGDLSLMPLMEAIDERWNIDDQEYLDGYGLRWRFTAERISRMYANLKDERPHLRWDALYDLSVFDPGSAVERIATEVPRLTQHREFEACSFSMCRSIARLRSPSLRAPLQDVYETMTRVAGEFDERHIKDIEHLVELCAGG